MSRSRFGWLALTCASTLLVFIALFPYLISAVVSASGCGRVGGACGAVATIVGIYLKPAGVLAFGLVMAWIVFRRLQYLELSMGWAGAMIVWLLGSTTFLMAVRNFWGANFSLGIGMQIFPMLLLFMLAFVVFLRLVPDGVEPRRDDLTRWAWIAAIVSTAHAMLLALPSILTGIAVIPGLGASFGIGFAKMLIQTTSVVQYLALGIPTHVWMWLDLFVFIAALGMIIVGYRSGEGGAPVIAAPVEPKVPAGRRSSRIAAPARAVGKPAFGRR